MDASHIWEASQGLIAVAVLVLLNGFFVAAEFALVTVRRTRVEQAVHEGRTGAASVSDAVHHLDSYIAACQLGITLASLALGWIGEPAFAAVLEPMLGRFVSHGVAVAIAFAIITALHVIVGELAPKGLALQYSERTAFVIALPLRIFRAIFRPAIWILNESGWAVSRLLGVRRTGGEEAHLDAAELRLVLRSSLRAGVLDENAERLLQRVLRFNQGQAIDAMVPRTEVVALPVELTRDEAIEELRSRGHSRYPVYRGSLDNVVGIVHAKDLLLAEQGTPLRAILRAPLVVPAQVSLDELMEDMRRKSVQFALVVDEYGGLDGIVTLEDVIEQIVGDLSDEFEQRAGDATTARGERVIEGLVSVDEIRDELELEVPEGDYHTVGGLVVALLGRIPDVGDSVEVSGYVLRVVEMDGLRVASVALEQAPERAARG